MHRYRIKKSLKYSSKLVKSGFMGKQERWDNEKVD